MQQEAERTSVPKGSRQYSTTARRSASSQEALISYEDEPLVELGYKEEFGMPSLPLAPRDSMKYRYEPIVKQVTSLLMRDGKLARAQSVRAKPTHWSLLQEE